MQNRELHFDKNGRFRILQVADTQEQYTINPNTLRLIETAVDRTEPDLVVMTGDQIKGYSPEFMVRNKNARVERTILDLCKPASDRGIPVTATFGNHDDQCGISNALQLEMYKKCPTFVYNDPADFGEDGTFCLSIDDRYLIWIFDTHQKDGHGGFGALHPVQLKWYRETRDAYEAKYGYPLPGMAFQHIPTPEYYDVIKKTSPISRNRVRAYGEHRNTWFSLDPHNSGMKDFMREPPSTSVINSGEIDAFLEKKDVKALFVGHDHNDSFVAKYKDIYLGFTQSCGFNVYGPGLDRGVRYIDVYPDGRFDTHTLTYRDLCGTEIDKKLIYAMQAVAPVSIAAAKTAVAEIGTALGVAGAVAGAVMIYKRKR